MMEIGFVVLHYKTIIDTINCVDSILKNVGQVPIAIVDNGSENGTGEKLAESYRSNRMVTVIQNTVNLGFAQGNNTGIRYLRKRYDLQFIVVMNNDTLIEQKDFQKIIVEEYLHSSFAVLGPQIITRDGLNISNPVEYIVDTSSKVKELIKKRQIKLILNKMHLNFLVHDVGTVVKHSYIYDNLQRYENVKLHGACWIFSKKFFERFEGLNPSTFLYFEEDILYHDIVGNGLKTVYNPKLKVKHLEDSSTNHIANNSREKNIFVLENEIKSLKVLMKILG